MKPGTRSAGQPTVPMCGRHTPIKSPRRRRDRAGESPKGSVGRAPSHVSSIGKAFLCVLVLPAALHAYLDPGAGSMLLQILVGGMLAAGAMIRLYWRRIKSLFGSRSEDAREDQ